jgi:hypothetical protein
MVLISIVGAYLFHDSLREEALTILNLKLSLSHTHTYSCWDPFLVACHLLALFIYLFYSIWNHYYSLAQLSTEYCETRQLWSLSVGTRRNIIDPREPFVATFNRPIVGKGTIDTPTSRDHDHNAGRGGPDLGLV